MTEIVTSHISALCFLYFYWFPDFCFMHNNSYMHVACSNGLCFILKYNQFVNYSLTSTSAVIKGVTVNCVESNLLHCEYRPLESKYAIAVQWKLSINSGHPWDYKKCPVQRGILISEVDLYIFI